MRKFAMQIIAIDVHVHLVPQSEMHEIYNDIKTSKGSFGMDVIVTFRVSNLGILSCFSSIW
jgi:hypothetical protein